MPCSVTAAPFGVHIIEKHLYLFFPLWPHSIAEIIKNLNGQTTCYTLIKVLKNRKNHHSKRFMVHTI